MNYNETTNTVSFDCPTCRVRNNIQFKPTFQPERFQEFELCCLACSQRLIITSWQPLYLIRDLREINNLQK